MWAGWWPRKVLSILKGKPKTQLIEKDKLIENHIEERPKKIISKKPKELLPKDD